MFSAWQRVWSDWFPEGRSGRLSGFDLMHYTISALSGLAATKALAPGEAAVSATELGYLEDTLVRELAGAGG